MSSPSATAGFFPFFFFSSPLSKNPLGLIPFFDQFFEISLQSPFPSI
ncbi:hypothetical protein ES332_D01G159600v1 [Gossypium tomentosum]|uniref:Uncharacterized protein n=1 Tax=Gossypium tomentosum TaxID=34277 RepID=A0A5D2MA58_GOSTO|nr:hypothetical protein ES332_D01G159600v1 [Gossypium tomentosum]